MIIAIILQMHEGHDALLSALAVRAEVRNPNGIKNKPESGWSLWRTRDKAQEADFDSGFSNLELGGYLVRITKNFSRTSCP